MSEDAFLFSSSISYFPHNPTNPNPNNNNKQQQQPPAPVKKKRNLPGNPDPEADVIALSPKTLMATNRFVCEICSKGFQRDQNLQLHRRGHNLPWKLRQRSADEVVRKRVYVCPEKTCVHHDPSRALGDLTGVKKHFSRKHGEKKWKCDKCSKKYAVQSDWKAHSKTCGTREYKCDCGTLFSRKDSFITHRAFCDALTEEGARLSSSVTTDNTAAANLGLKSNAAYHNSMNNPHLEFGHDVLLPGGIPQFQYPIFRPNYVSEAASQDDVTALDRHRETNLSLWLDRQAASDPHHLNPSIDMSSNVSDFLAAAAATPMGLPEMLQMASADTAFGSAQPAAMDCIGCPAPPSLSGSLAAYGSNDGKEMKGKLLGEGFASLYSGNRSQQTSTAHMSATALLQKAAQMGATTSNPSSSTSILNGFGGLMSSTKSLHHRNFQDLMMNPFPREMFGANQLITTTRDVGGAMMTMGPSKVDRPCWAKEVGNNSLTRDFLGLGGDEPTGQSFLRQELAKFASMDSAGTDLMDASCSGGQ